MYLNYNDVNLTVTRGDTIAFAVEFDGLDQNIDTAYFTCKKNKNDNAYVFQRSLNNGITQTDRSHLTVRVPPADTSSLEIGSYYYDLQIGVNGDVYTLLKGVLKFEYDIS